MAEIPSANGFAEFVAQLIADTFAAVVESQADQELQLAELAAAVALDEQRFAEEVVEDEAVEARLIELFPTDDEKRPHAIHSGAPYDPGEKGDESPPIRATLGLQLERQHIRISRRGERFLNDRGVAAVQQAVRLELAEAQLSAFRLMAARGVPRVLVDSGHIRAKVTFEITEQKSKRTPVAPLVLGRSVKAFSRPQLLPGRIMVRQADERSPQVTNSKIDVYGEVEVTFKTIT